MLDEEVEKRFLKSGSRSRARCYVIVIAQAALDRYPILDLFVTSHELSELNRHNHDATACTMSATERTVSPTTGTPRSELGR